MRISEGVEWGVHCAMVLAALPPEARVPGRALAELHGVSETYLFKQLQALTAAGLLESVPGPKGGYRLARPAKAISLLDLVQAIEGSESAFRCADIRERGPIQLAVQQNFGAACVINRAMLRAEVAWRESLVSLTLADLASQTQAGMGKQRLKLAATWLREKARL